MKHRGLYLFIALALGGVSMTAMAQSTGNAWEGYPVDSSTHDDRWYVGGTLGIYSNDGDRHTNSRQAYYGLDVGTFVTDHVSVDLFLDHAGRDRDVGGRWNNNTYGVSARLYAGQWDAWRPYAMIGLAGSYHANLGDHGWAPAGQLGIGLSKTLADRFALRIEAAYRADWDNSSQLDVGSYGDVLLGVTFVTRLGSLPVPPAPAPVVVPPPPPPSCDQLDDDHDGVNNCADQCPSTAEGILVGPDGCPQMVVIDLRGVTFKFDRPHKGETDIEPALQIPSADSMLVLRQAVDTLLRYPQVKVSVQGYTDSLGPDKYNQVLSERRAKIVYEYLLAHGIAADRLHAPQGHGESDPVASNKTEDGRALNRRVELVPDQPKQIKRRDTGN